MTLIITRPATQEAREKQHGEGPHSAGSECLHEEERREGEVRHFAEKRGVGRSGQLGCPKDGRGGDDGAEGGLNHAHVPLREVPGLRQRPQPAVEDGNQLGVPELTAQGNHHRSDLLADLDPRAATALGIVGNQGGRHLGPRTSCQLRRRVA